MRTNETAVETANALGASIPDGQHTIRVFVPSHDRNGAPVDQGTWVAAVAESLASTAGGVTVEPAVKGGWLNRDTGKMIWENPVPIFSFLTAQTLPAALPALRSILHRMGVATNQGEVGLVVDGSYMTISDYDGAAIAAAA